MSLTLAFLLLVPVEPPPRYALEPGLELVYTLRAKSEGDAAKKETPKEATTKLQINILKKNADGSFGIVFITEYNSDKSRPHWDCRRADIFPDGRLINESNPQNGFIANLFPVLPQAGEKEWQSTIERDGVRCNYTITDVKNGINIKEVRTGPLLNIYSVRTDYQYVFDPVQGLVTSGKAADREQPDPSDVPYHGTVRLRSITMKLSSKMIRSAEWVDSFSTEVDTFFKLKKYLHDSYVEFRKRTADEARKRLELVFSQWRAADSKIKHPGLYALYQDAMKNIDQYPRMVSEECKRRAQLLNKLIPTWEAKDFEGKSYSSESLKGKVVILDFWYRGCLWCVRAMPQMNQLANELKNENVVILGVNIDENVDDAKYVIRQAQLNYPSLQFHPEMQKVKHHELLKCTFGYPTLLIIDQSGSLAEIHAGYSPTLKKEVLESVRQLLTSPERK